MEVKPALFEMFRKTRGPFTIDRLAASYNAQLPRFSSRFWCPETEAVDAFTQNWAHEMNWICPPVSLIIPVLRHMSVCIAKGTLIVPSWPPAIFWPALKPGPGRFAPFVKDSMVLPKVAHMCIAGEGQLIAYKSKLSVFTGTPSFDLLALQVEF